MHIRPAITEDIPQLIKLGRNLLDIHYTFDPDYYTLEENFDESFGNWLKEQLIYPNQFILVATDEQSPNNNLPIPSYQIIGFISGFIKALFPWFKTKTVGHISYLVIDPSFRQKSIGKQLEQEAIVWFKSRNVPYVEVYVDELNNVGKIAWDKYGFGPFKKFLRKKI